MKNRNIESLESASTAELTERLAQLSIESHTINSILTGRKNVCTKEIDDGSIDGAIKGKRSVLGGRTDRNGKVLEIGDRVRVLTKGRIKVSHGTVFEVLGKMVTIKGDGGGVMIQRKSSNLAKY